MSPRTVCRSRRAIIGDIGEGETLAFASLRPTDCRAATLGVLARIVAAPGSPLRSSASTTSWLSAPPRAAGADRSRGRLVVEGRVFGGRRSPEPGVAMQDGMFLVPGKLGANPELWNNPKKAQLLLFEIIKNRSRHTVRHDAVLER